MSYKCPNCGSKDLFIKQCTVTGKMRLCDDGFLIEGDTHSEIVKCNDCQVTGDLWQFMKMNIKE